MESINEKPVNHTCFVGMFRKFRFELSKTHIEHTVIHSKQLILKQTHNATHTYSEDVSYSEENASVKIKILLT